MSEPEKEPKDLEELKEKAEELEKDGFTLKDEELDKVAGGNLVY